MLMVLGLKSEANILYYKPPSGVYYRWVSAITQNCIVYNILKIENAAVDLDKPTSVW